MNRLSDSVYVARRFQRSIKIDTDLQSPDALTGFICPASSANVLISMATHIQEGQAAFTWTGPYGSGKSSLVIALSALTSSDSTRRQEATIAVGETASSAIYSALPVGHHGWKILPLVGRRASVVQTVGQSIITHGLAESTPKGGWDDESVLTALQAAASNSEEQSGVIVFLDEMGKFLESAASENSDLYFFQLLAETAARSQGKLIVVGILHQAFEEYANRLGRAARDEWSKIQGRYIDLAVNTAGEEQIDLLSRAIQTDLQPTSETTTYAEVIARCIQTYVPNASSSLAVTLGETWPLHPIVAAILGPISRRRFGQNQRSLFSFLNSAEPYGFQDFISTSRIDALYTPEKLWDYLRVNLEPSIMASPDGHKWATAAEALDRCEASRDSSEHVRLLKTVALIDLFKDRSGLYPTLEVLSTTANGDLTKTKKILDDLAAASFIIFRKHINAYSLYAGSDFDIESAIEESIQASQEIDFKRLHNMASIHPVLAKRHYFRTGALRWAEVKLAPITELQSKAERFTLDGAAVCLFLLALPTQGETKKEAEHACREASTSGNGQHVVAGVPDKAWSIISLAKELNALETIRIERPELSGDKIARKEVEARTILVQNALESALQQALFSSTWYRNGVKIKKVNLNTFTSITSEIADLTYQKAPGIYNELLNRDKPSSSAVAAQNILLRAMVSSENEDQLNIDGYPAERGIYETVLRTTGLHRFEEGAYGFRQPCHYATAGLRPAWDAADKYLKENSERIVPLGEILNIWAAPPFGIKRGLMPVLATAYILSKKEELALYREGLFLPAFTDLDVDYLAKDPDSIQLRFVNLNAMSTQLLSGLSKVISSVTSSPEVELTPLDVARGIIAIYDKLPTWTKRTQKISDNAKAVRNILKNAHDPNQLLFNDLPALCSGKNKRGHQVNDEVVSIVEQTLAELTEFYPKTLESLEELMLEELGVSGNSAEGTAILRSRAEGIRQLSGDFRVDAFTNRLATYHGKSVEVEGIASLAANKPPRDWIDTDLDRARMEIVAFSNKFKRTEAYARVKQASSGKSISLLVSSASHSEPLFAEIYISRDETSDVEALTKLLEKTINDSNIEDNKIVLAALSKIGALEIEKINTQRKRKEEHVSEHT